MRSTRARFVAAATLRHRRASSEAACACAAACRCRLPLPPAACRLPRASVPQPIRTRHAPPSHTPRVSPGTLSAGKGIVPQNHSYTPFPLTTDPDPNPNPKQALQELQPRLTETLIRPLEEARRVTLPPAYYVLTYVFTCSSLSSYLLPTYQSGAALPRRTGRRCRHVSKGCAAAPPAPPSADSGVGEDAARWPTARGAACAPRRAATPCVHSCVV